MMGESLPTDYWDSSIKYQPRTDHLADTAIGNTLYSLPILSCAPLDLTRLRATTTTSSCEMESSSPTLK